MEFIRLSFKMAGRYKNRLRAGVFLIFLQNASILFGFCALFLAFGWMRLPGSIFGRFSACCLLPSFSIF